MSRLKAVVNKKLNGAQMIKNSILKGLKNGKKSKKHAGCEDFLLLSQFFQNLS